jgi:hypothetical protein
MQTPINTDLSSEREIKVAEAILSIDGYMAYLYAREDGVSHIAAMHIAWSAQRTNTNNQGEQQ